MREIKFRGRDEHGEWHYGAFMGVSYDGVVAPIEYANIYDDGMASRVFPDTVGQFTGIKDISGAEIYEGDIVSFKDDETDECVRGLVTYSVEGTWLVVCDGFSEYLYNVRKTTLILNNVHDVPELLEADDERD